LKALRSLVGSIISLRTDSYRIDVSHLHYQMDIGVKPFTVASEGVPMLGWPLLPELGRSMFDCVILTIATVFTSWLLLCCYTGNTVVLSGLSMDRDQTTVKIVKRMAGSSANNRRNLRKQLCTAFQERVSDGLSLKPPQTFVTKTSRKGHSLNALKTEKVWSVRPPDNTNRCLSEKQKLKLHHSPRVIGFANAHSSECHLHHYVGKKSSSIRYVHDGHRKELNIHSGRRNLLGNIEAY
ncbi:hypothetical protein J6590_031158, partial [Homalodisca vitripennis]